MTVKYEVREVAGSGFSMGSGRIGDTIQYAVFNGERKVWSSSTYFADSLQGRARNAIKAQATKSRNSYQSYYDRTGKCWEIEQDAKEGEKLFGDEVKALIDLTERKFASTAFAMLREGSTSKAARGMLYTKAREYIIERIECRRTDGYVSRYRKIAAYCASSNLDLLTEASAPFKV